MSLLGRLAGRTTAPVHQCTPLLFLLGHSLFSHPGWQVNPWLASLPRNGPGNPAGMKKTVGNKREYHVTCWLTHTKATRNRSTKAPFPAGVVIGRPPGFLTSYISRDGLTWTHHRGELNFPCWTQGHARTNTKPAFQGDLQSVATLLTLFPLSSPVSPAVREIPHRGRPVPDPQLEFRSSKFQSQIDPPLFGFPNTRPCAEPRSCCSTKITHSVWRSWKILVAFGFSVPSACRNFSEHCISPRISQRCRTKSVFGLVTRKVLGQRG